MIEPAVRLRTAIVDGSFFIVSRLVRRYPDLIDNINPENGWSNLHYAAYYDRYDIAELLLKAVAERSGVVQPQNLPNSTAPIAPSFGPITAPTAPYSQITSEDEIKLTFAHDTVIHCACKNNAVRTLDLLLDYFNVCIDQRGDRGFTLSHVCCENDHADCLRVLLDNGAYPNIQDDVGNTPLHLALQYGFLNCIELLAAYRADDQVTNNDGWTPADLSYDFDVQTRYAELKRRAAAAAAMGTTGGAGGAGGAPALPPRANASTTPSFSQSARFHSPSNASTISTSKITLPAIQSRKYSLSSRASSDGDADSQFLLIDNDGTSVSTASSLRLTRNPSPIGSLIPFESVGQLPQVSQVSQVPPVAAAAPDSSSASVHSPVSKRSSMTMRTFRSNSQTSDLSPIKQAGRATPVPVSLAPIAPPVFSGKQSPQLSPINTSQASASSGGAVSASSSTVSTPKALTSFLSFSRPHSLSQSQQHSSPRQLLSQSSGETLRPNRSYSSSLEIDDAAVKLNDFRLQNESRVKLGMKLSNMVNKSQESLNEIVKVNSGGEQTGGSCGGGHGYGVLSSAGSDVGNGKRSRIMSIPISSLRGRRLT